MNSYLCQTFNQPRSFDFRNGLTYRVNEAANTEQRGTEFNELLIKALNRNPDLFENYTNKDIADVLVLLNKVKPDDRVLIALYEAYNPSESHELNAWELGKRIEFLKALDADPVISAIRAKWTSPEDCPSDDEKKYLAAYQHELQARIYGFAPGKTEANDKPPTGPAGGQNIWSASYSREDRTLYFNTHVQQPGETMPCTFRLNCEDFQATIAHDTIISARTISPRASRKCTRRKSR